MPCFVAKKCSTASPPDERPKTSARARWHGPPCLEKHRIIQISCCLLDARLCRCTLHTSVRLSVHPSVNLSSASAPFEGFGQELLPEVQRLSVCPSLCLSSASARVKDVGQDPLLEVQHLSVCLSVCLPICLSVFGKRTTQGVGQEPFLEVQRLSVCPSLCVSSANAPLEGVGQQPLLEVQRLRLKAPRARVILDQSEWRAAADQRPTCAAGCAHAP
jgi:hypothetical protein